jgi:phosphatidylglycerophosphatase A
MPRNESAIAIQKIGAEMVDGCIRSFAGSRRCASTPAGTAAPPMPTQTSQPGASITPGFATLVATFFGIGWLRPGPGTWASAVTVLLWGGASYALAPSLRTPVAIAAAAFIVLIGIPAATQVCRATGARDPQFVVIDEVAGQLIALIAVPLAWKTFVAGFILFRGFDILKPPPLRQLEKLPEGAGIVLDDVAAGLLALLIMHLLLHFGVLR